MESAQQARWSPERHIIDAPGPAGHDRRDRRQRRGENGTAALSALEPTPRMDLERASDKDLIEAARSSSGPHAEACLAALYERFYPQVARWCLRICGNREEAADLAQEVFLRVHSRLDSFRMESSFSTWLYTVTRSVTINQGMSRKRRESRVVDFGQAAELVDASPGPRARAEKSQTLASVRTAMRRDLEPVEARVVYLHYVAGLTLPAITHMLKLENKSGAKAFIVSGVRKLKRKLHPNRPVGGRKRES